jgi:gamma-glutamyltranspeptidase / glutathione hydrolase
MTLPQCSLDRWQARSMVVSRSGVVAAESPLAAQAGATILARGGNAVDGALAAAAVMTVVAPMENGLGGDLFALVYDEERFALVGLNASGWAPAGLTLEAMRASGNAEMPVRGIHSVTVPGVVDGWLKLLERFGSKKLDELLAPAIHHAEEGFPVGEQVAAHWAANTEAVRDDPEAAKVFLPGARPPKAGEVFRNPDFGRSLRLLAREGREAFYRGEIARRIVELSERLGGTFTREDLGDFSAEWVEPLSIEYRGWQVSELPPQCQGVAALEMLNLVENFPLGEFGHNSADALHVLIEAKKLAYADLAACVGDPRFVRVPVEEMLSKSYARRRAGQIDSARAADRAAPGLPPARRDSGGRARAPSDTTYLCAADRHGRMISLIQSNYQPFGSGLVPPATGFPLQNRGAFFSLDPASPNALAGRKRPFHTIIPAFMARGDVRIVFGIMGAYNQALAHAQFVANVADFGMNVQAALEAPRFTKHTFDGRDAQLENRIPEAVRAELARRGHELETVGAFSHAMGAGQAILRDFSSGVSFGASDPRKDGAAVPEPVPA